MLAFEAKNPDYKKLILEKLKGQHFMKHIGMAITDIEPGYVTAEVELKQIHNQQDGITHGGVTATIADIAMGFAAFSLVEKGKGMVTSKLEVSYLNPSIDGKLIAKGKVIKAGNRLYYCEADIINERLNNTSTLVAKSTGIMCTINLQQ
ncbi:MAG: PaaI family thioesterase [Bacteroidia bacterium]|nr:PaaI family thioesterase [Bacteroidia bacterium]